MKILELLTIVFVCSSLVLNGYSQVVEKIDSAPSADSESNHKPVVVFLVRHAEKADVKEDPDLSDAGRQRALMLARMLRDAKIDHVHSSDYKRTRNTAAPPATKFGADVQLYDPRDLPGLAKKIRNAGGRHLVVGHSNTTPAMVKLLGGDAGQPIDDAGEYDRFYVVTTGPDGSTSSVMLRYGEPLESK